MFGAREWAEIRLVQRACVDLSSCYDCLSLSQPRPLSLLMEKSISFSQLLVQLEEMRMTRYTIAPVEDRWISYRPQSRVEQGHNWM